MIRSKKIIYFTLIQILLTCCIYAQWQQTAMPPSFAYSVAADSMRLFVGDLPGLFYTTNSGVNWINIGNGLPNNTTTSVVIKGTDLFTSVNNYGIYFSSNTGANWNQLFSNASVQTLAANGQYIFAGCSSNGGMFKSTNNGANWSPANSGLESSPNIYSIFFKDSIIYAGTAGGVYISTNNGNTWFGSSVGLPAYSWIRSIISIGQYLFLGISNNGGGVYMSDNNGASWAPVRNGLGTNIILSLSSTGTNIFAAASIGGIFLSTNYGTSWNAINDGLPSGVKNNVIVKNSNLFTTITNAGVWKRPVSEVITAVSGNLEHPEKFKLEQNYPNPFNPTTNIEFRIRNAGMVKLSVYNSLGQVVSELVNKEMQPGKYKVDFNAGNLPTGVYFYKLESNGSSEIKKMILAK